VRTLIPLLFQPGKLSVDYLRGKRISMVAPLRLYLYVSFFFFWLLAVQSKQSPTSYVKIEPTPASAPASASSTGPSSQDYATEADDLERKLPTMSGPKRWFTERIIAALRKFAEGSNQATRDINDGMLRALPKVVFVLVPVFAALLYALFRRSRKYYIEHLIVALHLHSFFFVIFGFDVFVSLYKDIRALDVLVLLLSLLYAFFALRRVYALPVWSTTWRAAVAGLTYLTVVVAAVFGTLVYTFTLM
jgi:hypothetical protein